MKQHCLFLLLLGASTTATTPMMQSTDVEAGYSPTIAKTIYRVPVAEFFAQQGVPSLDGPAGKGLHDRLRREGKIAVGADGHEFVEDRKHLFHTFGVPLSTEHEYGQSYYDLYGNQVPQYVVKAPRVQPAATVNNLHVCHIC